MACIADIVSTKSSKVSYLSLKQCMQILNCDFSPLVSYMSLKYWQFGKQVATAYEEVSGIFSVSHEEKINLNGIFRQLQVLVVRSDTSSNTELHTRLELNL